MPNDNESKFKELLGDLNFFNKLAAKGKGMFQDRGKAITHPDDCDCKECKLKNNPMTVHMYTTDEIRKWRGGRG